jgi:putative flippase GtrA
MSVEAAPVAMSKGRAAALRELVRFAIVGVINTTFGYAMFWIGLRVVGLSPGWANAVCYALSLCLSFLLMRYFVFRSGQSSSGAAALRFGVAFGGAFLVNQAVLWLLLRASVRAEFAQVGAMISYTVVFFLANKFFVFSRTPTRP